ncbi:MAG: GTP-binding protein [Planctomycetaceae bacterium]
MTDRAISPAPARYVMIGGFLGAGKTTCILRAAERFAAAGLRVGLVTNDQAGGLVDTALSRARDLPVEEIAGGCFCCRFNSLVEAADRLSRDAAPDILLAEPVGSCTDLVATVSVPLARLYCDRFTVAPVSVVVDPLRAMRILGLPGAGGGAFSPNVAYIYRKQLEEAEIVVVNKCDLVDAAARAALVAALGAAAPGARIHEVSAREGTGLDAWFDDLLAAPSAPRPIPDIDYDRYADGEALLGWLNAEVRVGTVGGPDWDGNARLVGVLEAIRAAVAAAGHEIAHLKATLSVEGDDLDLAAANLVRSAARAELSHRLAEPIDAGRLLVNLRAEADPERLLQAFGEGLAAAFPDLPATVVHCEHFRPGRPVPTHRMPAAV